MRVVDWDQGSPPFRVDVCPPQQVRLWCIHFQRLTHTLPRNVAALYSLAFVVLRRRRWSSVWGIVEQCPLALQSSGAGVSALTFTHTLPRNVAALYSLAFVVLRRRRWSSVWGVVEQCPLALQSSGAGVSALTFTHTLPRNVAALYSLAFVVLRRRRWNSVWGIVDQRGVLI